MRLKAIAGRLAAALLLLLFLAYIGFQVFSNLRERIVTVDATVVTVEDKLSVEGVFVRAQQLVTGEGSKTAEYLVADGARVGRGQNLALFFESGTAMSHYQAIQALDSQIEALGYVMRSVAGGSDAKRLDDRIYSTLTELSAQLDSGNAKGAAEGYPLLQQMALTRGSGMDVGFAARIEALQAEKKTLQGSLSGSTSALTAPASGYFFRYPDGFETVLTPDLLPTLTPEALRGLRPDSAVFEPQVAGTLVESYAWYFVAICDKAAADAIKDRAVVDIYFPQLGAESITVGIDSAATFEGETLLVLKSGLMDSRYLATRNQPADLVISRYTGIKVPREALRQVEGQWGVYCLDGAMAKFKPVKWIYQTDTYVLVEQAKDAGQGLYMYDKIIIRGKQISDNMVLR